LRRLYRRHRRTASDQPKCPTAKQPIDARNYHDFTKMNPVCNRRPGFIHLVRNSLRSAERLAVLAALRRHFRQGRQQRRTCGDDHVTQTLACCSCRGIAGCSRVGADFRFRLGRSSRRMARRLGRSPRRHRWPGLLRFWLWRLLCASIGPNAVGASLALGKSLLLIQTVLDLAVESPGPSCRGFPLGVPIKWNRVSRSFNFRKNTRNRSMTGNIFRSGDLVCVVSSKWRHDAEPIMSSRITNDSEQIDHRTSRSICDAIGERLQLSLRPDTSRLSSHLQHLMDELRRRDSEGRWRSN